MSGMTARLRAPAPALLALALAGVSLPWAPSTGAAQETVPALEAAARRYGEVSAICADFEQVIELRLLRRTVASAGRICQRRPNLFSMRFTDPDGDMVIADGEHVWLYYPSIDAQQVIRRPAARSPGREDFFREFLEDTGTRYRAEETGSEEVDGRDCRVVVLTPLEGASYRRARLWLDARNHLIRRVEVHEPGDRIRTVTLRAIDLAAAPDPALFVFEVPAGARVAGPPGAGEARR